MGRPSRVKNLLLRAEYIGTVERTQGTETSKYLEEKRTIVIPLVVASENGTALKYLISEWNRLGRRIAEGDNPVHEAN